MPRAHPIQNQFTVGEVSPKMYARIDLDQYRQGARRLANMLPLPHGGLERRAGTRFVAEVKDSTHQVRLLPFEFGVAQAYVIELGHDGGSGYMRFFRDQGQIPDGGGPVEISSPPWAEAELFEVMFAQSADVMYFAHPGHVPKTLTRLSHTSWTLADFAAAVGQKPDPDFNAADNYPGAVTFFAQRLCWAASNANPQTIWLSAVDDYTNLLAGTNPDDAFKATPASPRVNNGRWLLGADGLFFGTAGRAWRVDTAEPTPVNFPFTPLASTGVAYRRPIEIDNRVLFVSRYGKPANDGRRLYELRFDVDEDEYTPDDISIISEHLTCAGMVDMAWQEQPNRVLWAVCADGRLVSVTYYPRQRVIAWAPHPIGGIDAAVESVAVIPGANGDEVWLVVRRRVNGVTKRYVEVIDPTPAPNNIYVDSAIVGGVGDGPATDTWIGLDHLEGETVSVLADDAPAGDFTVSGGRIVLPTPASDVVIGLACPWTVEPLNLEAGAADGTAQGRKKSISRIVLRLLDSGGVNMSAKVGVAGKEIPFREVADLMDTPVPLFTGDITVRVPSGWDEAGRVILDGAEPLPVSIIAIIPRVETND